MPIQRCRLHGQVEVLQWTGSNTVEVANFLGDSPAFTVDTGLTMFTVDFVDRHGVVRSAGRGDYLVRGLDGNVFPVSPEFYAENYQPVPSAHAEASRHQPPPDNSPDAVLHRYRTGQ